MKLKQKSLLKGSREFELKDDEVLVKISAPFEKKQLSVPLAILNPEPEIEGSYLHFHSRVKCGPLLSLFLNKPNEQEFNDFVDAVKQKAEQEFSDFAGIK